MNELTASMVLFFVIFCLLCSLILVVTDDTRSQIKKRTKGKFPGQAQAFERFGDFPFEAGDYRIRDNGIFSSRKQRLFEVQFVNEDTFFHFFAPTPRTKRFSLDGFRVITEGKKKMYIPWLQGDYRVEYKTPLSEVH
ncbi:hypothetical protein L0Y46_03665 [bacterium]|nr:hypothetical protein [bacterium]